MDMTISELPGPITLVKLAGRMDAPGADAIGLKFTAAVAAQGRPAVVDMADVSFIASMGLRLIISAARAQDTKGLALALFGAQPMVQSVFDDAALDQILPITASIDEAVEAVST
jgi:anti-sigma B factor antagonist